MGLGILEPATSEHVPGTARLEDIGADERNVDVSNLRHNKNGIILVPQPSSSPNDPLVSLLSLPVVKFRIGLCGGRKVSFFFCLQGLWLSVSLVLVFLLPCLNWLSSLRPLLLPSRKLPLVPKSLHLLQLSHSLLH